MTTDELDARRRLEHVCVYVLLFDLHALHSDASCIGAVDDSLAEGVEVCDTMHVDSVKGAVARIECCPADATESERSPASSLNGAESTMATSGVVLVIASAASMPELSAVAREEAIIATIRTRRRLTGACALRRSMHTNERNSGTRNARRRED